MKPTFSSITIITLLALPHIGKVAHVQTPPIQYKDGPQLKIKYPQQPTYYQDLIKARDKRIAKAKADKLAKIEAERKRVEEQNIQEASQAEVVTSQVVPASPTSSSGCVSGYVSGDVYLDKIIAYESGGDSCATNSGGCFGLLQACPGEPLRNACGGGVGCQLQWFIDNKTGGRSWEQIWQHELDFGWW